MKKIVPVIGLFLILILSAGFTFAQCTPDPAVTDPEGNGEMVPDTLYATELEAMNITLSIIAPGTVDIPPYGSLPLHHIVIKSITNKPAWVLYSCDAPACEYNAGSLQCALVTGTPPASSAGVYPMDVLVDVYAMVLGTPTKIATDYNSGNELILIVQPQGIGINDAGSDAFSLIPNQPNPFSGETKLGVKSPVQDIITLSITDMLGNSVYVEKITARQGENFFAFSGRDLQSGIYFYTVVNSQNQSLTKKMVKID
jgi:hypothetical protein